MPLTDAQKRIYASAPAQVVIRQALVLQHPGFSKDYLITNSPVSFRGRWEGVTRDFLPVPFEMVEPRRDDTSQQDLRLSIDNVDPTILLEIENAAQDFGEPITCTYLVFSNQSPVPQNDPPIVLFLSAVEVSPTAIVGTATRSDVVNAEFPRRYYRINEFPGLSR